MSRFACRIFGYVMGAAATPSIVTTVAMTLVTAGVLVISFRTPNAWLWG